MRKVRVCVYRHARGDGSCVVVMEWHPAVIAACLATVLRVQISDKAVQPDNVLSGLSVRSGFLAYHHVTLIKYD